MDLPLLHLYGIIKQWEIIKTKKHCATPLHKIKPAGWNGCKSRVLLSF